MNSLDGVPTRWRWAPGSDTIRLGLLMGMPLGGLFLLITLLERKWLLALFMGLLALAIAMAIKERRTFFLLLFTLSIPIGLDLNFYFKASLIQRSSYGFMISLSHLPLLALLGMAAFRGATNRGMAHRSIPGLLPLAMAMFCGLISVTLSSDRLYGVFDLFALGASILLYFYVSRGIEPKDLFMVILAMAFSVAMEGCLAFAQYVTSSSLGLGIFGAPPILVSYAGLESLSRAGGTLGHPNSLALYMDLTLPVIFSVFLSPMPRTFKIFMGAALMAGLSGLFATLSRGGIFSTSLMLTTVLTIKLGKRIGWVRSIFAIGLVLCLSLALVLGTPNKIRERFFSHDYGNAYGRLTLVKVAFNVIKANPFFGVGLSNFTAEAKKYDRSPEQIVAQWNAPVHNLALYAAGELGLVGLAFFMIFLSRIIVRLRHAVSSTDPLVSSVGLGLFFSLLGFLIHTQVDYCHWTHYLPLWFTFGLAAAVGGMGHAREWGKIGNAGSRKSPSEVVAS